MAHLHYHIERPTARTRYIVGHVLGRMSSLVAEEVSDRATFDALAGPKLIYGHAAVDGAFRVVPYSALEGVEQAVDDPPMATGPDGVPLLFPVPDGDLPFDPFAAAFQLLARVEEHGPIPRDVHGRPETRTLHAARHGYLDRPVVDEWLYLLWSAWSARDPRLPRLQRRYRQVATLDVDNGFMYLGRPLWRTVGAAARDLLKHGWHPVRERIDVLAGRRPDPYDVHALFRRTAEGPADEMVVNYLVAPRGPNDHAVGPAFPLMRERMREATSWARIGLHPGYDSSMRTEQVRQQKQVLEQASGVRVTMSRQHFLRFRLPETFQRLVEVGITDEYSMGLADRAGFRAGTCTPYPFFDLTTDRPLDLMVHPFTLMDSALYYKERLTPEQAIARGLQMVERVRAVQGTFIAVWHERFLSDHGPEKGWRTVVEQLITAARP